MSLVSHASAFSVSQISLSFLLKSHQTLSLGRIHPESRMIFILMSLITSAESLFLNQALFTDTGGQYLDIVFCGHYSPSLVAQVVKNLPATWGIWVGSLDQEDPLEKGMATHSSIFALEKSMARGAW